MLTTTIAAQVRPQEDADSKPTQNKWSAWGVRLAKQIGEYNEPEDSLIVDEVQSAIGK